jgi:predicted amidohydrolase YtcJ
MLESSLTPELILVNGRVMTVDAQDNLTEAVATAMGRIVAIGDSKSVLALRGPKTRVIDLKGRTVLPGLIDSHVHLADNGVAERFRLDCRDFYTNVRSLSDLLAKIKEQAAHQEKGSWIIAQGSPMQDSRMPEKRYPDRRDLDAAAPDHPVAINFGAHLTCINTRAMQIAGLTKHTAAPAGGHLDLDAATGELTGMLKERAQALARKHFPAYTYDDRKDAIIWSAEQCLAKGITSVHDIVTDASTVHAYHELMTERRLPIRVSMLVRVIESEIVPESLLNLGLGPGFGNEWLRLGGVKMSVDGGLTGRNALFSEPYVGEPCNCGMIRIQSDELESTVDAYHRAGQRVCIHAMGDVAMDMALDAIDKSVTAHPRFDHRHRIEHMGNNMVTPARIARMKRLGILPIPNVSFLHHVAEAMAECLGSARMVKAFNLRQMLDAGLPLTQGSDAPGYWPVDVLRDLGTAVSRRTWRGGTFGAEEGLTIAEALRMCTATAAFSSFEERIKGSIESGKLADLTVLSEDPRDVPPENIKNIPVAFTIVDGAIAYESAAA